MALDPDLDTLSAADFNFNQPEQLGRGSQQVKQTPQSLPFCADIAEKMRQRQAIAAIPQNQTQYPAGTDMATYGYDQNVPDVNPGTWSAPNQTSAWSQPMQPQMSHVSSTPQTPIQNGGYTHFGAVQQTPVSNGSYAAPTAHPESSEFGDFEDQDTGSHNQHEQVAAQDENLFQINIPATNSMITSRSIVLPQPHCNLIHRRQSGGTPTPRNHSNHVSTDQQAQSVLSVASTNIQASHSLSRQSTESLIGTDQDNMPFGSDREVLTDDDIKLQPPPSKKVKNTQLNIATDQPFMDVVGDLDVHAADAWKKACDELCIDMEIDPIEFGLIKDRVTQVCRQVKDIVHSLAMKTYGFVSIEDCDDEEGDNKIKFMQQSNHELYDKLKTKSMFAYLDPNNKTIPNGLYCNKITSKIINKQFFSDVHADGAKYPQYFTDGIPLRLIAFVLTAVELALDKWHTGQFEKVEFKGKKYEKVYNRHLDDLQCWKAFTEERGDPLAQKLQNSLLERARSYAGVAVHSPQPDTSEGLSLLDFMANQG
ncbi:hypothetical protein BDR04DRAFT_1118546 [Suillus decipiens]|nr:hypothetical protein BDR04DRAFT_1118546 [Suillus decipiens]